MSVNIGLPSSSKTVHLSNFQLTYTSKVNLGKDCPASNPFSKDAEIRTRLSYVNLKSLFYLFFIIFLTTADATVSSKCLQCVCEGATQCNLSARCHQPYVGGNYCGPFHLSFPFWRDSGKPVIGNDNPESEAGTYNEIYK